MHEIYAKIMNPSIYYEEKLLKEDAIEYSHVII